MALSASCFTLRTRPSLPPLTWQRQTYHQLANLCINHASPNQGQHHLSFFVDHSLLPIASFCADCTICLQDRGFHEVFYTPNTNSPRSIPSRHLIGNLATPRDECQSHNGCVILSAIVAPDLALRWESKIDELIGIVRTHQRSMTLCWADLE